MKQYFKKINDYFVKDEEARESISTLEATVGDNTEGLVKDVADLKVAVGDNESGLVKDVTDLQTNVSNLDTIVGDSESGLVKDVADLSSAIDESTSYSSNEIVVGTWINGKPLYRKVIDLGDITDSSRYDNGILTVPVSEDIDKATSFQVYGTFDDSSFGNYEVDSILYFEWYDNTLARDVHLYSTWFKNNSEEGISIVSTSAIPDQFTGAYAIIEYTKTTDDSE